MDRDIDVGGGGGGGKVGVCDGLGEQSELATEPEGEELPLLVQESSLETCGGGIGCCCTGVGEGVSSLGDTETGTICGGTEGVVITAGGGIDLTPLEEFAIEPFLVSQTSIVNVGGKCFEFDPVKPEAAILDLSDFG